MTRQKGRRHGGANGPWVGLLPEQAKTLILRASLAFKVSHDRWPTTTDGQDDLLQGFTWSGANGCLNTFGTSLYTLCSGDTYYTKWPADADALLEIIKRAASHFELVNGRRPTTLDGPCADFDGGTWSAASHQLEVRCGLSLSRLLRFQWPKSEQKLLSLGRLAAKRWKSEHHKLPSVTDGRPCQDFGGGTWVAYAQQIKKFGHSVTSVTGKETPKDRVERIATDVAAFYADRGRLPSSSTNAEPEEQELCAQRASLLGKACGRAALRSRGVPETEDRSQVLRFWKSRQTTEQKDRQSEGQQRAAYTKNERSADQLLAFFRENDRMPCSTVRAEARLYGRWAHLRSHPETLSRRGLPAYADPSEGRARAASKISPETRARMTQVLVSSRTKEERSKSMRLMRGRPQWASLAELLPKLCRCWKANQRTCDVEGDSGTALNAALANAASVKTSQSRGLGEGEVARGLLCGVNGLHRANTEIEHDCWRFTLKGAKAPDSRKWADILASGDNKKIETAERVAFLDWENPGADGKPVRRPWSPPADKKALADRSANA